MSDYELQVNPYAQGVPAGAPPSPGRPPPPNFAPTVAYTKRGELAVKNRDREYADVKREDVPILCSQNEIERRYGPGVRLYYSFLKFNACANLVLAVTGIVSWALFMESKTTPFTFADFFISNYMRPEQDVSWFWCCIASLILWPAFAFCYLFWERCIFSRLKPVIPYDNAIAVIPENAGRPVPRLILRRVFAFVLMGVLLGAACAGIYGLIIAQNYVVLTYGSTVTIPFTTIGSLFSLAISLYVVICNLVWDKLSEYITGLEKWRNYSHLMFAHSVKVIVFKLILATVLYAFVARFSTITPSETCLFYNAGVQFLSFFVIDIVVTNLVQIFLPIVVRKILICCGSTKSPDQLRPKLTLSNDYLQVLYRQFILYIGILVFPMIGCLGFVANLIEFPIDRLHLMRLNREPHFLQEKPGFFLLIFLLLVGLFALFTYPNGGFFVLFLPSALPVGYQNCSMTGVISRL